MFRRVLALRMLIPASILVLALVACGAETVVIATDGEYHPFNFVNETTGEVDGLERELGDELCSRAGLECEWIVNEWEEMIPDLRDQEFDVIMAGMSITPERDELIDFTEPYYPPSPSVYLALAGAGDQAANGKVGAHIQTIHSDYFDSEGRSYQAFDDPETSLSAVLSGEIDALLVDRGYAVEKLTELEGQLAIVGPEVPLDQGLGMGVREGSDLREKFNEGISSMKEDGTLNDLLRKWIGENTDTF